MEKENRFLNKYITIKKVDGSWIKGICSFEDSSGFVIFIKNSGRTVFIPSHQVSEIILGDNSV